MTTYPNAQNNPSGAIPVYIVVSGSGGYTPNASLVFPATCGLTSTALISGGTPSARLTIFNNTTAAAAPTLWVNEAGGTAIVGKGIPILAGGSYFWANGLTTIPTGISDGGSGGATSVTMSGSGG